MKRRRIDSPEKTLVHPNSGETLAPGTVVLHTYQILSLLNKGGMGEVYKARHLVAETLHAVKIIRPELVNDPKCLALFKREAKVIRAIKHDAVVNYDGLICDQDGRIYLVMEFIEGPTLGQYIHRYGKLTPAELAILAIRLAEGIAAFHAKNVVHRDLSPDNIIIPEYCLDRAKLIDFGIAKQIGTGTQSILGTEFAGKIAYAAPERLNMQDPVKVDGRADLYSLGMVLLTAAKGELLNRLKAEDVLTELPPPLSGILAAMLERNPLKRPQSADEIIRRLTPAGDPADSQKPVRNRWFGTTFRLATVVSVLFGISGYLEREPAVLKFRDLSNRFGQLMDLQPASGLALRERYTSTGRESRLSNEEAKLALDQTANPILDRQESADQASAAGPWRDDGPPGQDPGAPGTADEFTLSTRPAMDRKPVSVQMNIGTESSVDDTATAAGSTKSRVHETVAPDAPINQFNFQESIDENRAQLNLKSSNHSIRKDYLPLVNMP